MLTTRLSNLGSELGGSRYEMRFLDEDQSWNLFCKSTFGDEEIFPDELEGIGKKIVENCKGLPLSIVVVGGLLSKSKRTREYLLYISENLSSTVNLQDDESSLKILRLSYKELPVYLKPCFLYMGVYPEDCVIDVSELMRLWVAEGFLKPISGKLLEAVAKEYLNELVGRNLVLVHETGYSGETIKCKIHDLLVDVCVREVCDKVIDATMPFYLVIRYFTLRLRDGIVNCRYISGLSIQLSYSTLWNLQTLYVHNWEARVATSDIWNPQLRHVSVNLLDPPPSDGLVLGNLQTLSRPLNFR
ncbi:hypothetical protein CASFOL_023449 [Castilleja foliolosa]|uniref:Disease resistance protein winged helix domain-containing protein n=1 Tax=Castilleja foliolosa TaxID=1961234 RepID=A0ABD3CKL0_9LAMI